MKSNRRIAHVVVISAVLVMLAASIAIAIVAPPPEVWMSGSLLGLGLITASAALCLLGGLVVVTSGIRRSAPEITVLGASLVVLSLLALGSGLMTPEVWFGPNESWEGLGLLALPAGVLTALPVLLGRRSLGRGLLRHALVWCGVMVGASVLIVILALTMQPQFPWLMALTWPLVVASALGLAVLAIRYVHLARLSKSSAPLAVVVGLAFIAVSLAGLALTPAFSSIWWLIRLWELLAIAAVAAGLFISSAKAGATLDLVARVVSVDSLDALEIGLLPPVRQWQETLTNKDPYTRGHVARVGELSMRVGERMGLRGETLRLTGLGALMHDIGKIEIPDSILRKPGKLEPQERNLMESHTEIGDRIMRSSPALAPAAEVVRGHHERWDSNGYPDALGPDQIPLGAAIAAACDAYDAMTTNRAYRSAMPPDRARSILREGAGSQWSPAVVAALIDELQTSGAPGGDVLGPSRSADQNPYREHEFDVLDDAV